MTVHECLSRNKNSESSAHDTGDGAGDAVGGIIIGKEFDGDIVGGGVGVVFSNSLGVSLLSSLTNGIHALHDF
jgi:hypothetical protein